MMTVKSLNPPVLRALSQYKVTLNLPRFVAVVVVAAMVGGVVLTTVFGATIRGYCQEEAAAKSEVTEALLRDGFVAHQQKERIARRIAAGEPTKYPTPPVIISTGPAPLPITDEKDIPRIDPSAH